MKPGGNDRTKNDNLDPSIDKIIEKYEFVSKEVTEHKNTILKLSFFGFNDIVVRTIDVKYLIKVPEYLIILDCKTISPSKELEFDCVTFGRTYFSVKNKNTPYEKYSFCLSKHNLIKRPIKVNDDGNAIDEYGYNYYIDMTKISNNYSYYSHDNYTDTASLTKILDCFKQLYDFLDKIPSDVDLKGACLLTFDLLSWQIEKYRRQHKKNKYILS